MAVAATCEDVPVRRLLVRGADELDRLAGDAQRLHALVERQLEIAGLPQGALEDAQLIDFLVQHLEALGGYLRLLADQVPIELVVDPARTYGQLKLADLDRRLAGLDGPDHQGAGQAPGDLDLL
jgi:hypothetical protein